MELITLIFYGLICFLIAHFFGKQRQIGFEWSLIFCLLLTPIIGFLIIMLSRKHYQENYPPSKAKRIWGILISIFSGYMFIESWYRYASRWGTERDFVSMITFLGILLVGVYLYQLGKGKNFNIKALTKYDN
jgi:hypothetical protein